MTRDTSSRVGSTRPSVTDVLGRVARPNTGPLTDGNAGMTADEGGEGNAVSKGDSGRLSLSEMVFMEPERESDVISRLCARFDSERGFETCSFSLDSRKESEPLFRISSSARGPCKDCLFQKLACIRDPFQKSVDEPCA